MISILSSRHFFAKNAGLIVLHSLIFFALATAVLFLAADPALICVVWYANAWGTAVLVNSRMATWPFQLVGFGLASYLANRVGGAGSDRSIMFTIVNLIQVLSSAGVIRRLRVWDSLQVSISSLSKLILGGIVTVSAIVALFAGVFLADGYVFTQSVAIRWFVGATVGSIAILPLYAALSSEYQNRTLRATVNGRTIAAAIFAPLFALLLLLGLQTPFSYIAVTLALLSLCLTFSGTALSTAGSIIMAGVAIARGWHELVPVGNEWLELPRMLTLGIIAIPALVLSVYVNANRIQGKELQARGEELENELAQRRQLFENSSDGVVLLDSSFHVVLASTQMTKMLGLPTPAITAEHFTQYFLNIDEGGLHERLNSAEDGRAHFDANLRRADGTVFPTEVSSARSTWKGSPVWMLACRDISERRQTDRRIQSLLEFSQKILDTSPAGVLVYDSKGQCILTNPAATRVTGVARDILLGQNYHSIPSWKDSGLLDLAKKAMNNGLALSGVFHITTTAGKDTWMECFFKRFEEAGDPRLLLLVTDNSDRMRAQTELEQTRHDLQQILDAMPSLVAYWDKNLLNRFTNRAYQEWIRMSGEEIAGKTMTEVLGAKNFAEIEQHVENVLRGQEQLFERTVPHEARPGNRQVLINYLPDYHDTEIAGFYVLVHDISTVKQAEEELRKTLEDVRAARARAEEASIAKSQFVANMSHEIRTPMNAVLGLTQLLQDTALNSNQQNYVSKILSSSKALLHVLNDILDFAKVEAGHLSLEQIPFSLEDTLENVSDLFAITAAAKGVELIVEIAPEVDDTIIGDPLRVGQVLNNLVGNAVKFTNSGEIHLKVSTVDQSESFLTLQFSVRDTGIGISSEQQAHLFDAFTQADSSTTRQYGGTGLGLTISKHIVGLMGGSLTVQSELGSGSTFTFKGKFGRASQQLKKRPLPLVLGARTLIVDDNPISCEILQKLLGKWGLDTLCAPGGRQALDIIHSYAARGEPVEYLLLDWHMPEMDGLALARILENQAASGELSRAPTIIMVTEADRQDLLEAAGETFSHPILLKPVTPSRLYDVMVNLDTDPGQTARQTRRQAKPKVLEQSKKLLGMHVLLVEDNPVNQQVATEILRKMNVHVTVAGDGPQAVQCAEQIEFDAILMDLQMPGMDGFETTKRIRQNGLRTEVPIIAMTAAALTQDREATSAAGMNGHVAKPIDIAELVGALLPYAPNDIGLSADLNVSDRALENPKLKKLTDAGINVTNALARFSNNQDFLLQVVQVFLNSFSGFPEDLQKALAEDDTATALRIVHNLKGSAGNIDADQLYKEASLFEEQLSQGASENVDRLINVFENVRTNLQSGTKAQTSVLVNVITLEQLDELETLIEKHLVIPDETLTLLHEQDGSTSTGRLANQLADQLDQFDYASARGTVKLMKADLLNP